MSLDLINISELGNTGATKIFQYCPIKDERGPDCATLTRFVSWGCNLLNTGDGPVLGQEMGWERGNFLSVWVFFFFFHYSPGLNFYSRGPITCNCNALWMEWNSGTFVNGPDAGLARSMSDISLGLKMDTSRSVRVREILIKIFCNWVKYKNLAGLSSLPRIGVFVVRLSWIRALKKHAPLIFMSNTGTFQYM